jgi:hypothetical protein
MKIKLTPPPPLRGKCLVIVGGSGDTAEKFSPLTDSLAKELPDYTICSFGLSSKVEEDNNLLEVQVRELEEVFDQLISQYAFVEYTIFCTSMGAYSTIRILNNPKYSELISTVIFFDPADYYTGEELKFANADSEITWSGYADYSPTQPVISSELKDYNGQATMHVVHLTVKNHGPSGYVEDVKRFRGDDSPGGHPRLNTNMVKKYYSNIPKPNLGEYLEVPNLPHALVRDGNISRNISKTTNTVKKLLKPN